MDNTPFVFATKSILKFSAMWPSGTNEDIEIVCDEMEKCGKKDREKIYCICLEFRCGNRATPLLKRMLERNLIPNIENEQKGGKYFEKLPGWAKNILTRTQDYEPCHC